jgi:hypothetical protein
LLIASWMSTCRAWSDQSRGTTIFAQEVFSSGSPHIRHATF